MRPLGVLSIDWDYLVNASMEERMIMFPDGGNEDLPALVSDYIWASRYAEHKPLKDIGVDEPALNLLKEFIKAKCGNQTQIAITDSHKHAFNVISGEHTETQPVVVINVDFHHDCYGNPQQSQIDCGNWVTQLFVNREHRLNMNPFESRYFWVKRDSSEELEESYRWKQSLFIDSLKDFEDFAIDVLFICRSRIWSPPHLDEEFFKFCNWCQSQVGCLNTIKTSDSELYDRYTQGFQNSIEVFKAQMEEARKQLVRPK